MTSKRGQYSPGYAWLFGLVTLFGLTTLFIVFDQVFVANLAPTMKNMINGSSGLGIKPDAGTIATVTGNIDFFLRIWHALPWILAACVIIFMIVSSVRKEGDSAWR
jgi:hypothetical protein